MHYQEASDREKADYYRPSFFFDASRFSVGSRKSAGAVGLGNPGREQVSKQDSHPSSAATGMLTNDKKWRRSFFSSAGTTAASTTRSASTHGNLPRTFTTRSTLKGRSTVRIGLPEEAKQPPPKPIPAHVRVSRAVIENRFVTVMMAFLTIWVLIGDDIRMLCTNKPVDLAWGAVGCCCIILFSVEIIFSCFGKADYFLGFFFALDLVSTGTLVLDLPWVSDAMNDDGNNVNKAARGRTARVGAKAARFVRVLRLVRVVKLYKAMSEGREERERKERMLRQEGLVPGDPEYDEEYRRKSDDPDYAEEMSKEESRVGKRLSEITTRRVILLVLVMLLGVPVISVDDTRVLDDSAAYGVEEVWVAYQKVVAYSCPLPAQVVTGSLCDMIRRDYERALLRYVYYHNWFTANLDSCPWGQDAGCPRDFYAHIIMVGMIGSSRDVLANESQMAALRQSTVDAFQSSIVNEHYNYDYGSMPDEIVTKLGSPWLQECSLGGGSYFQGISFLDQHLGDKVSYLVTCPDSLRPVEKSRIYPQRETEGAPAHMFFLFDKRKYVQEGAAYSLAMTGFVCVLLLSAALMFHNDVSQLVLYPVEQMISRVQAIQTNPMAAIQMAEEEFRKECSTIDLQGGGIADSKGHNQWHHGSKGSTSSQNLDEPYHIAVSRRMQELVKLLTCSSSAQAEVMETLVLERTIIKLGSLLVLGFGEAGANIVAQNMKGMDSSGVSAMVEGTRVDCIIGHARIQDFSIVTEVLQSEVMTFVNQVSEIIHGVVDEFHGAPNKNNGDTFLLIWRTTGMDDAKASKLHDLSVIAFGRIVAAVHQSPVLAQYRGHPGLQFRVGSNYRVSLTCGLHSGWAIEGAVGSEYKIDASYLSPNVSVATHVEEYTQLYGVTVLATEAVAFRCTQAMKAQLRLIDHVYIPGSKEPLKLHCLDLYWAGLRVEDAVDLGRHVWSNKLRFKSRQWLEVEKSKKWRTTSSELFEGNAEIAPMRNRFTEEFFQLFSMGYQNYHQGEWKVAMTFLKHTRTILGFFDGPSIALLDFMAGFNFEAPEGWDGVRDLDEASKGGVRRGSVHEEQVQALFGACASSVGGSGSNSAEFQPRRLSSQRGTGAALYPSELPGYERTASEEAQSAGVGMRGARRKVVSKVKQRLNKGMSQLDAELMASMCNEDEPLKPAAIATVAATAAAATIASLAETGGGDGTGGTGSFSAPPPTKDFVTRMRTEGLLFGKLPSSSARRVVISTPDRGGSTEFLEEPEDQGDPVAPLLSDVPERKKSLRSGSRDGSQAPPNQPAPKKKSMKSSIKSFVDASHSQQQPAAAAAPGEARASRIEAPPVPGDLPRAGAGEEASQRSSLRVKDAPALGKAPSPPSPQHAQAEGRSAKLPSRVINGPAKPSKKSGAEATPRLRSPNVSQDSPTSPSASASNASGGPEVGTVAAARVPLRRGASTTRPL